MNNKIGIVNKRNISILAIVISILIILVGGTCALIVWSSEQNTEITVRVGENFGCGFEVGPPLVVTNMGPVFNYKDGEVTSFTIVNYTNSSASVRVSLDISTLSNSLKSTGFKYAVETSTNNSTFTKVDEGNFSAATVNASNNLDLILSSSRSVSANGKLYYKIYFYIDASVQNSTDMQSGKLVAKLNANAC